MITFDRLVELVKLAREQKPPIGMFEQIYGHYYSPYYSLMYHLTQEMRYCLAVELGVEKGRGVASLAAGSRDCFVIGLDTFLQEEALKIKQYYKNVQLLEQPALPMERGLWARKINILHIDNEHSYATAKADFEAYEPYLAPNAVVLFDDTHAMDDGVLKYVKQLDYPTIHADFLHPICGYAVVYMGSTKVEVVL